MREDVSKRGVKATRRRHNVRGTCVRTGGRGGGGFAHVLADEDDTDIGVRVRPSVEGRFDVRAVRFCGRYIRGGKQVGYEQGRRGTELEAVEV